MPAVGAEAETEATRTNLIMFFQFVSIQRGLESRPSMHASEMGKERSQQVVHAGLDQLHVLAYVLFRVEILSLFLESGGSGTVEGSGH